MRNILFRIFFPSERLRSISEDYPRFLRTYLESNLNLLYAVCVFLMFSETILLILPERAFDYHSAIRLFLPVNGLLILIHTVIKKDYTRYSYLQLSFLQYAILANTLLLATNLNLSSIGKTDYIHPFIIGLTFVVTGLELSPLSTSLIVLLTGIANLVGMWFFQTDVAVFFTSITNIFVFIIVAWMLGILVSRVRVSAWLDKRDILIQNEILEDLTKRDSMTRFFNHESILSHLKQQITVFDKTKQPLCVLILDVDDFKKINDNHGHLKGDEILLMIAKNINMSVRECDIIGRYGGEEFFLIFPNTDLKAAIQVAERIRKSIEANGELINIRVTISGGLALYEEDGVDDIIRKADRRLYEAKRNGKNQIVSE